MLTYNLPEKELLDDKDSSFDEAVKIVFESGMASASFIQRRLRLGYARAARLIDQLEEAGVISSSDGNKPRRILVTKNEDGEIVIPQKEIEKPKYEQPPVNWHKSKYAGEKSDNFEIELGTDENKKLVSLNLECYGNLLIIGSQFTSAIDLLNNILATSMAKYSPDDLKFIVIEGVKGDLIVPDQASHLLTPIIIDHEKSISALKWSVSEVERRMKMESQINNSKVIILINSFNQLLSYSSAEVLESLYRIISIGRKYGFYFVIATDYPNPRTSKEIIANCPAKLVFKPTDKKIARDTGIPESADLVSPDEAILETMFEGKKKITIKKVNPKQIYEEIFE